MDRLGVFPRAASMNRTIRLGLIGAGPWGKNYIRTIAGLEGAALTRVASRRTATAALVSGTCVVSQDWKAVAKARDLDGVIIATPPALHADMAAAALENGLPVLVEKPLTMDFRQAASLLELARRRGGLAIVDHTYLFHPAYEALKKRAVFLGPIRSIRSTGGNRGVIRRDTPVLWDWGPHDVALALDLMEAKPLSVEVSREKIRETAQGQGEIIRLNLHFPGGVVARMRIGNLMERRMRRLEVCFERKALVFDDAAAPKLAVHDIRKGSLGPGQEVPCEDALPLTRAVESFVEAIRSGSREIDGLEFAVDVIEVLSRCQGALEGSRGGV